MRTTDSILGLVSLTVLALANCTSEPPGPPLPPQLLIACKVTPPDTCKPEIDKAIAAGCKVLSDISDESSNRREVTLECAPVSVKENPGLSGT